MVNGEQCVIIVGIIMMLVWCVDNWDLVHMGIPTVMLTLVKDQGQYG